ncbi:MAG: glycosyltransferase family 1 protein [Pseudomonadota bacterium]
MRIGINGRFLVAKRTGVQRAAYNIVKTLVEVDRDNEYVIFTGKEQVGAPEWNYPNVTVVGDNLRPSESIRNHFWEQVRLPRLAKQYKIDILHSPANVAPIFYSGKSVIHIHDLCFVVNPQWYSFTFRTVYNIIIPILAKRATKVITDSNNSRNDLLQYFNLPAERVSLVYLAVDDTFSLPRPISSEKSSVREDDYILYAGSLEPRKNINILIEAYEKLRHQYPAIKTKLILIGGESPLFASVQLNAREFRDDVVFKGFVSDAELSDFYRRAKLVAYPSLYEGFGLPPLEAMASGSPVVTSSTSSIPEVVGNAAILINPRDQEQLTRALHRVLTDSSLRKSMIKAGAEQVLRFNWYRVARGVLSVYYEVHQRRVDQPLTVQSFIPVSVWSALRKMESLKTALMDEKKIRSLMASSKSQGGS